MNKLPLIHKSCFMEQSFVTILDPTSILFKNVTPYCSRFAEIKLSFETRLRMIEEACEGLVESLSKGEGRVDDEEIQRELRRELQERSGGSGNAVGQLFGLPVFRFEG